MKEVAKMWNSSYKGKQKRELSKGKFNRTEIYIYIYLLIYIYIYIFFFCKASEIISNTGIGKLDGCLDKSLRK